MSKTVSSAAWKRSNAASVGAVGVDRKVSARGAAFFNRDRWTARVAQSKISEIIRLNGEIPLADLVSYAVQSANGEYVPHPEIVVAAPPERLDARAQRASIGGNYHEAAHSLYSCTRDLSEEEVMAGLQPRLALLPMSQWAALTGMVLHWGNLIEDIRIERVMCREYPGASDKLSDLQDLILQQEGMGQGGEGHKALPNDDLRVIMGAFRDLGLGYQSETQKQALLSYKQQNPAAYALVESGDLRPMLDRAINMDKDDDLGHWWLALEVVAYLVNSNQKSEPEPQPPEGEPEPPVGDPPVGDPPVGDPPVGEPQPPEPGKGKDKGKPQKPVFRKGDRVMLRGVKHEVTFAGPPDAEGRQALRVAPVVDE